MSRGFSSSCCLPGGKAYVLPCVTVTHFWLQISAVHWNQDEDFGGFGGPHCMVPGGYGAVTDALARLLPGLRLSTPVASVEDADSGVKVTTASGPLRVPHCGPGQPPCP